MAVTKGAALSRALVFAERGVAPIRPDREHVAALPDGRRVGAAEFGERAAVPIVYFHGFLGSRLEAGAAEGRTSNIIGLDRPAYGRTDPQPAPSLAAFGRDARDTLDWLGVGRCLPVGVSAGAPYALAAALALGPERAPRLILIGGIGGPDMLEAAAGGAEAIVRFGRRGPGGLLLRPWLRFARCSGLDRTLLGLGVAAEAEQLARHGVASVAVHERLLQSLRAGNGADLAGPTADARLLTRPWDVDPGALAAEALVLHGADDPVVPPDHAAWYGARLPRARVELLPCEHHLSACFVSVPTIERVAREVEAEG